MLYTIPEIQKKVAPIARKHDLLRVFLFGSYARGEADADSDVDFVIDPGYARGIELVRILRDLRQTFEKNRVDMITVDALRESEDFFSDEVEKNEVLIYEK